MANAHPETGGPKRPRAVELGALAAAGLALRLAYTGFAVRRHRLAGDAYYYSALGRLLARGRGFINPYVFAYTGRSKATAQHPPLYPLFLGAVSWVGARSELSHRVASSALGAATVVAVGVLGGFVAGRRAGLIAAGIAALYPNFWASDVYVLSESLTVFTVALVLIAAYAFVDRPTLPRAVALGALIGVAALTRAEIAAFLVLLAVPLVWVAKLPATRRVALGAGAVAAGVIVMAPWIAFNLARFDRTTLLSTGGPGGTMAIASCNRVWYGSLIGVSDTNCGAIGTGIFAKDESQEEHDHLRFALHYIRAHKPQIPVVVVARVGRVWDVFRPWQTAQLERVERGAWPMRLAVVAYFALVPLAIAGGMLLWQRRVTLLPMLAAIVLTTLVAAAFFGTTRFRPPADIAVVVFAAVAIDAVVSLLRPRIFTPRHG